MKNNLPTKYKEGFFHKLKTFFANLFGKKTKSEMVEQIEKEEKIEEVKKEEMSQKDIFSQMKEESKKTNLKEDIFNMVNNNPELLNTLTLEQLEEIDKMYDQKIEEKEKKINKLKRVLA